MKLTVKTSVLQSLVTKAVKASTNNKLVVLTSFMAIDLTSGTLSITTCDGVNYFTVSAHNITGEDFSIVVRVELFSKIVSKITTETVSMELTDKYLMLRGNGEYKIELPLDEEGDLVTFPSTNFVDDEYESGTIKSAFVKSIILANKPSLALTAEIPSLMNYYCGKYGDDNIVVTSDKNNICYNKIPTFTKEALISPMVFDILALFEGEDINYKYGKSVIEFTSPTMRLFIKVLPYINEFPIDSIVPVTDVQYPSECVVSKTSLLSVLGRLGLFIMNSDGRDIPSVVLNFTDKGLLLTTPNNSASETIPYQESTKFSPFSATIALKPFQDHVSARSGDIVRLQYGIPNAIKIVDNNIVQIMSYLVSATDSYEEDVEEVEESTEE